MGDDAQYPLAVRQAHGQVQWKPVSGGAAQREAFERALVKIIRRRGHVITSGRGEGQHCRKHIDDVVQLVGLDRTPR